jgi:sec-independent protein translocase protein TatA
MFGMSTTELALILVIVLILFGAGRLPQVFEQFGKGIKAFKEAQREDPVDVTPRNRELPKNIVTEVEEIKEKV